MNNSNQIAAEDAVSEIAACWPEVDSDALRPIIQFAIDKAIKAHDKEQHYYAALGEAESRAAPASNVPIEGCDCPDCETARNTVHASEHVTDGSPCWCDPKVVVVAGKLARQTADKICDWLQSDDDPITKSEREKCAELIQTTFSKPIIEFHGDQNLSKES